MGSARKIGHRDPSCTLRLNVRRWHSCAASPRLAVALMIMLVGSVPAPAQNNPPSEYQLKAAFLYSFAKFIDWPSSSFASPQSPFAICILGLDPFGPVIDDTLRGKTVGDRPVVILRARDSAEVRHCQIVFISSSEKRRLPDIFATLQGANVLIVGESDRFADSGGTIQLTLEENHIRFAINTDVAESSGLRISSKLLALARVVHSSAESGKN